jgi:hypothetical protein
VPLMAVSGRPLNSFERTLFRGALLLAGLLIAVRLGSIIIFTFLHHSH